MQIAILGPLAAVTDDGAQVTVTGARLRTLLILLAVDPGRVVTSSRLIDGIWGADPPAEAANALQALVSRLRRTGLTVESRPAGYRLAVAPDDVDIHRFERLATVGRRTLDTDAAGAAATLRTALDLWRGPALADVSTTEFAQAPIARLTELRLAALGDRAEADLRSGVPGGELAAELESLLAEHPLHEPFAALLMRALARAGRTGDALAVFARTKDALATDLGADPSAELRAVHLDVLRGDGAGPAPLPNTNLRAALTSFVGRDAELARVVAMAGESRLVTLTGPGGSGKTRLAVEAGRALLNRQPEGVWLVELAPVVEAEVAQAVLGTLGLRAQPLVAGRTAPPEATEPVDRLAAALSTRPLLLILDNCEHVIGAAAALVHRLLGDCPQLRVLATSREPLGITGETLWPVDPLTLPPPGVGPVEALSYPAMRLLADRARAVRPAFTTDDEALVATMGHVCRALDGLPLAIELAAARLRTMSLDVLAARLDDRFRLLTGGSRTALPRHQTLRAVVDWSWDLLDEPERMLLRRLPVFAAGATLEAVEQVCADPGLSTADVLDLLTALADKSLVIVDGDRYRLLETIKAYGRERLADAGEWDRVRAAFVDYFSRLAATAEPHLRRAGQLDWLLRLSADHDNLHAALRVAIAGGDTAMALRMLCNAGWYWWLHGDKIEAAELAGAVLAMPGDAPVEDRAMGLAMGALVAMDGLRDEELATQWFSAAVRLAARAGHRHPMLRLIGLISEVFRTDGHPSGSFQRRAAALLADEDPWVRGTVLLLRAHAEINAGRRHEAAEADFRAALAEYRAIGERWGISNTLCALGESVAWRGDLVGAVELYREAVALFAELVTNEDLVRYKLRLASLLYQLGEHEAAQRMIAGTRRDAELAGLPECLASVAHTTGELARLAGDYERARGDLERAALLAEHVTVAPQFRALITGSLGYLETAVGDLDAALARHQEALRQALRSNDSPVIAQVLVGLADVIAHRGEPDRAALLLGASASIRGMPDLSLIDFPRVEAATRAALGEAEFAAAVERGRATTVETLGALLGATFAA